MKKKTPKKPLRLKSLKEKKDEAVGFRCKEFDKNSLQGKADLYTGGNLGEWLIYAGLNYVPSKDELE